MSGGPVTITIHVEADYEMEVDDVWPDGDAPDVVTAEAVRDLMESQGTKRRVLSDWCLDDPDVDVTVSSPNPAWKQDTALIESATTRWLQENARVWRPARLASDPEPAETVACVDCGGTGLASGGDAA